MPYLIKNAKDQDYMNMNDDFDIYDGLDASNINLF